MNTEWKTVRDNINRSTIFRFSYKKIIGESLTGFITRYKDLGLTSFEVEQILLSLPSVKSYFNTYPMMKDKFIHNIKISVSSRYAEQDTLMRKINK